MHSPEYLIFRAGSWWGKPSKEFLVSLVQICLWFSKIKQMKHLELGGEEKKQFPNSVQPATKTELLFEEPGLESSGWNLIWAGEEQRDSRE